MSEQARNESAIRRFNGDGQDPQKDYKLWKRWSRAYLAVQRAKGTDENVFGAMLFTMLDGTALRAFDAVNMDDLEQSGGQDLVYQVLDERFPEEAVHDRLGEVLDKIFDLKVEKGESTSGYTGKARAAFSAAEAEGVRLPSVARGYLLLRFAKLPQDKKAVVMAAARQSYESYEEQDIAAALRTTYPEGLYSGRSGSHVATVEPLQEESDVGDVGDVFLAEDDEGQVGDDDPIEEQDAIDVLLTWKQTRQSINKEKLSRGLNSGGLKKLEARVKCYKCQKVGHFSRNCPQRKGKASGKGDTSSGSTRVSLVYMVGATTEISEDDQIAEVMRSWADRPKDSWTVTEKEVVRHHVNPRSSLFSPARTGCPVPIGQLSMARMTEMKYKDGTVEEQFTPNWKNSLEAHRKTPTPWTGRTISTVCRNTEHWKMRHNRMENPCSSRMTSKMGWIMRHLEMNMSFKPKAKSMKNQKIGPNSTTRNCSASVTRKKSWTKRSSAESMPSRSGTLSRRLTRSRMLSLPSQPCGMIRSKKKRRRSKNLAVVMMKTVMNTTPRESLCFSS